LRQKSSWKAHKLRQETCNSPNLAFFQVQSRFLFVCNGSILDVE